jgi:hypothetical protein
MNDSEEREWLRKMAEQQKLPPGWNDPDYYQEPSPSDFLDKDEQEAQPKLPPFKASALLYSSGVVSLFCAVMLPLIEMINRTKINMPDTFIELLEWNPYSQLGLISLWQGLFFMWLGLMVDRRGA